MIDISGKRLLIISNNPLSNTNANGKTILSYFDTVPRDQIRQLYFRDEKPTVEGIQYFRISDNDVIKGIFASKRRGSAVPAEKSSMSTSSSPSTVKKNDTTRLLREILWWRKWKSEALINWLDEFSPTAVFFVAGDSGFSYDICMFVVERYNARLSVYITDDYIMPRNKESLMFTIRRSLIKSKMKDSVAKADSFFTISNIMRSEYRKIFGIDSNIVVNMPDKIRQDSRRELRKEYLFVYAGALNYGRYESLHLIANAIKEFNSNHSDKQAILKIFTNRYPSQDILQKVCIEGASEYGGSLNRSELNKMLNDADVLVFVESFEDDQIEKTRFSLSTKVPEYLSAGKPIFAIGPAGIGSMDYLSDVSICCYHKEEIYTKLENLLNSEQMRLELAQKAYKKYKMYHDKAIIQEPFVAEVFGVDIKENEL